LGTLLLPAAASARRGRLLLADLALQEQHLLLDEVWRLLACCCCRCFCLPVRCW
jgi:hypothetical protein